MPTKNDIHVSFVLATYNRVEMLLHTLGQIGGCGLKREEYEICVVDNASSDGTVERVRREYPDVRVTALNRNAGACAKAYVERSARGRYVVYLDDEQRVLLLPNLLANVGIFLISKK